MTAFACSLCAARAGTIVVRGAQLRRETFTGVLTQAATADVTASLFDVQRLHALDPELVPFYCPSCDAVFCGDHWERWDVFDDDGFHDCIRGRCPRGHERLLED